MISERGLHTYNDIRVCKGDKSLFVASKKAHYMKLAVLHLFWSIRDS